MGTRINRGPKWRKRAAGKAQIIRQRAMAGRRQDRIQISAPDKRRKPTARTRQAPSAQKVRKTLRARERWGNRPVNHQPPHSVVSAPKRQTNQAAHSRRASPRRDKAARVGRRKRPKRVAVTERPAILSNAARRAVADKTPQRTAAVVD